MIKDYYLLTKPGIIYGNAITAAAGFFLASKGHVDFSLFLAMLLGISFVIGSACVFNNYIDRDIDKFMARTKKRALVSGIVSGRNALIYATVLGIIGFSLLILHTNFFLVVWQMPHFYAISIFRLDDYAAAGIPVLPIKKGMKETKIQIFMYIIAFIFLSVLFTTVGLTGYISLCLMLLLGVWWLTRSIKGFKTEDNKKWARKLFGASLVVLLVLSLVLSVDVFLPF